MYADLEPQRQTLSLPRKIRLINWGLVLLIFGLMVLSLGRKGQGVIESERAKKGNNGTRE